MLKDALQKLTKQQDLTQAECRSAIEAILAGADTHQVAAFLALLHAKQETSAELMGIVEAMLNVMRPIHYTKPTLDIVGTGGDGAGTVNISTAASLCVASLGITVSKHGNRSVSSKCGSADLLESLGIPIELEAQAVIEQLDQYHFAFIFSPYYHPAMQKIKKIRQALAIPTAFNLLGPLLNPCRPDYYLAGVYLPRLLDIYADIIGQFNIKKALIVNGNGLDEISCLGPNQVIEINQGQRRAFTIDPKDYGFTYCKLTELQGGDATLNKQLLLEALSGKQNAIRDTIVLNAATALAVVDYCDSIQSAIPIVTQQIEQGKVIEYIKRLNQCTTTS